MSSLFLRIAPTRQRSRSASIAESVSAPTQVGAAFAGTIGMHLVQLLLPITDDGESLASVHADLRDELASRFGGVTAYSHSPAKGIWKPEGSGPVHDDIILLEVVVEHVEAEWWRALRHRLEKALAQDSIIIRANEIMML